MSVIETLSSAAFIDLTKERFVEKATTALLDSAKRQGVGSRLKSQIPYVLNHVFFRLSLEERLLLVGLHCGQWNYARLSKILKKTPDDIQQLAWKARIQVGGASPPGFSPCAYPSAPGF